MLIVARLVNILFKEGSAWTSRTIPVPIVKENSKPIKVNSKLIKVSFARSFLSKKCI